MSVREDGGLIGCGIPGDRPVLEVRAPAAAHRVLVGDRIAERAGLPACLRPRIADPAVDFVCTELRRPVDRALLNHAVAAAAVGRALPAADRNAEKRGPPAEREVLLLDR